MLPKTSLILAAVFLALPAVSQQATEPNSTQPQVRVNMLNVCTPSAEEQKEIAGALARIPKQPLFGSDFEISHGVSTLTDAPNFLQPALQSGQSTQVSDEPSVARYVRIRREFSVQALFSSIQYSFSDDGHNMVETLVLHVRDPKELIQVSIEDSASSIGSVTTMLSANTPASRIRLERFGKSSVALARCGGTENGPENGPAPDQSAYEPLFRSGSEVLANYRSLLGVRHMVPAELAQIPTASAKMPAKPKSAKSAKSTEADK
ncbi:MAG: hypothetical protein WAM78_15115 [Candidatus Sulfotelmatobacter sp.]